MQLQYLLLVTAAVTWPGALQRNIFSQIHTNSAEPCPAQTHRSLQLLDRAELRCICGGRGGLAGGPGRTDVFE